MTLRLRLVASLGTLLIVGLLAFGAGTYGTFARSQWTALDEQLRSSMPIVTRALTETGNVFTPTTNDPRQVVPVGTYAELRDVDQQIVNRVQFSDSVSPPVLPSVAPVPMRGFTVGSKDGKSRWRVIEGPSVGGPPGTTTPGTWVVVAIPTSTVDRALRRLVVIETAAGGALLLLLSSGSWLILRRGLRPLETMASSARSISGGRSSQRVSPADAGSEVGQLGLAINSMLDRIDAAFMQRDATEQQLRRFLADASHELRTPLTSIQGFAELYRLSGDQAGVTQFDQGMVMARIEDEAARMKRLVEDLLLLARLDETRPFDPEAVDLAVLAADACTDAVVLDPTRHIELDAPSPVVLHGNRDHLRQALANLVTNAVKHTPPGTRIEVSARWVDRLAVVVVRDHGPGLSDEALAHVFDRFWQADQARVGHGSGLGLSIVSGIAAEHGGTVTAANAPDAGAVFTLSLPPAPDNMRA